MAGARPTLPECARTRKRQRKLARRFAGALRGATKNSAAMSDIRCFA
jgi:hypothetical protein